MRGVLMLIILMPVLFASIAKSDIPPAFKKAGAQHGLPPIVLYSIALCETGRNINAGFRPWPWTLNVDGKGQYFKTKEAALVVANNAIAKGASVDIGIMQVNWGYHSNRFSDVSSALDPYTNLNIGSRVLKEYTSQKGSLWRGIGRFHSGTPALADKYQKRCLKLLIDTLSTLHAAQ